MGQKSSREEGSSNLGIRDIKVEFKGACMCPSDLVSSTTLRISAPIRS
jgi:hypothetical protein